MSKSIITDNWEVCYHCKQYPYGANRLSRHELIPGSGRRKKCIEDGLVIPLHLLTCHDTVQHTAEIQAEYERLAQEKWIENYGTKQDFFRRYGKNFDGEIFERSDNLMKYRISHE